MRDHNDSVLSAAAERQNRGKFYNFSRCCNNRIHLRISVATSRRQFNYFLLNIIDGIQLNIQRSTFFSYAVHPDSVTGFPTVPDNHHYHLRVSEREILFLMACTCVSRRFRVYQRFQSVEGTGQIEQVWLPLRSRSVSWLFSQLIASSFLFCSAQTGQCIIEQYTEQIPPPIYPVL